MSGLLPANPKDEWDFEGKKFWLGFGFFALTGLWVALPFLQHKMEEGPAFQAERPEFAGHGLKSLDPVENPQGAPGFPLRILGAGSTQSVASSQSSGAEAQTKPKNQDSVNVRAASETAQEAAKLSTALKKKSKADQNSRSDMRSGFPDTQSKRFSGGMEGHAFGGSEPANVSQEFFKARPISSESETELHESLRASARSPRQSMEFLKRAAKAGPGFLQSSDEQAASSGHKIFDSASSPDFPAETPFSAGVGIGPGDKPENLKKNDPRIHLRKFEPPKIGQVKDVDSSQQNLLGQQIMMMVVSAAIGGLLGPVFSGIGMGMARGIGLQPPNPDGGSNIRGQTPLLSNN